MNIDRNAPVGVFDSGIGGLTVAREIMRNLPSEKIVYFGDTARVPYGSKSRETVIRYSRQIIHFLQEQKVKAIVVACNTASAFALDAVKDELDIPILGVIEAGAKVAAQETRNKRVGIIGTVGTVGSGIHASYLKELDPDSEQAADIVIADVPCSGYGVIGKKPEIKYRATPQKQEEIVMLQRMILDKAAKYVKPDGTLIFSTCTIAREENEENVLWFLKNYPYRLESLDPYIPEELHCKSTKLGYLQLLPGIHKTDGFFIARFRRK